MALLMTGFVAALRVSELLRLRWSDLKPHAGADGKIQLVVIKIRKSKTDIDQIATVKGPAARPIGAVNILVGEYLQLGKIYIK